MSATKKVFIKTFGCQMNEYDSSRMADLMQATEGMQQTEIAEEADLIRQKWEDLKACLERFVISCEKGHYHLARELKHKK